MTEHAGTADHLPVLAGPDDAAVVDAELVDDDLPEPARSETYLLEQQALNRIDAIVAARPALAGAARAVLGYLANTVTESTRKSYAAGWAGFQDWCDANALTALPAEPATVALYIATCATGGRDVPRLMWSTIVGRLAAIAHQHEEHGYASPTAHPIIRRSKTGIARTIGTASTGKAPLRSGALAAVIAAVRADQRRPALARLRDPAILLVTAYSGCRRSEIAAVLVRDAAVGERGLRITLPGSKTDQTRKGRRVLVPPNPGDPDMCPVRALLAWADATGVAGLLGRTRDPAASVPLWRGLTRTGQLRPTPKPLTDKWITELIKEGIGLAGLDLDPADFAAHSMRHAYVTEALDAGADATTVALTTGHRDLNTLRRYDDRDTGAAATLAIYERNRAGMANSDDTREPVLGG